jgi:hypothetical protein
MLPASIAVEAIELDRNHIKRLVLGRRFDLTAICFGNYRSPQSIGILKVRMVNPL